MSQYGWPRRNKMTEFCEDIGTLWIILLREKSITSGTCVQEESTRIVNFMNFGAWFLVLGHIHIVEMLNFFKSLHLYC